MIHLEGQYSLDDFKHAQQLHAKRGAGAAATRLFLGLITAFFFVSMLVLVLLGRLDWAYLLAPLALFLVFLLYQYLYRPLALARTFRKNSDLAAPFEMDLSQEGLSIRNPRGEAQLEWGKYIKWVEDRNMLLLYRSYMVFQMLPKRLFAKPVDLQFFRDQLERNRVPDAGKLNKKLPRNRLVLYAILVVAIIVMLVLNITGMPR